MKTVGIGLLISGALLVVLSLATTPSVSLLSRAKADNTFGAQGGASAWASTSACMEHPAICAGTDLPCDFYGSHNCPTGEIAVTLPNEPEFCTSPVANVECKSAEFNAENRCLHKFYCRLDVEGNCVFDATQWSTYVYAGCEDQPMGGSGPGPGA